MKSFLGAIREARGKQKQTQANSTRRCKNGGNPKNKQ